MAEMTIRLQVNPETGKKDIVVSLRSDEDALPQEHERRHRELVDKLVEGGLLSAAEAGEVIVQREEEEQQPAAPARQGAPDERRAQAEGN